MINESRYKSEITRYRTYRAGLLKGHILDVGGGLGAYLPYFGSKNVTVLDVNKEALEKCEWDDKVVGDACHLPFSDGIFDNVWACSVCMLLPDDISVFIQEAKRVLKVGGQLVIELPNPDSRWNKIKRFLHMRSWEDNKDIKHMYHINELKQYGCMVGEVRFLPKSLDEFTRNRPQLWHTFFLTIEKE